jgi:hypothetical protein
MTEPRHTTGMAAAFHTLTRHLVATAEIIQWGYSTQAIEAWCQAFDQRHAERVSDARRRARRRRLLEEAAFALLLFGGTVIVAVLFAHSR